MSDLAVNGIYVGKAETRWLDKPKSAIGKQAVDRQLSLEIDGFVTDEQADLSVHGGMDKAVHHYPGEHYATWRGELERDDLFPGGFGENISTQGMAEDTACIGDVFRLGTATVQISQGRQPCWKLNAHTREPRMAYLFQKTGRTGWYYRVLETGTVNTGDRIGLLERTNPDWTVARVTSARLTRRISEEDARCLASLTSLAEGWRKAFERMAEGDRREDTSARLGTG